jgi:hypothetical protein
VPRLDPRLCIECKGYKLLCGLPKCPILSSYIKRISAATRISNVVEGSTPPSAIVGETGYPNVSVYIGIPPGVFGEKAKIFDDPRSWHMRLGLEDIIELRSSVAMVSTPKIRVSDVWRLYETEIALAVVSVKPVDSEAKVLKVLERSVRFDYLLPPSGPRVQAESIRIVGNPTTYRKLEQIIFDDVKASEGIRELYSAGVDLYTIIRALSLGMLGMRSNRKLVPTRWAITAVDINIGNMLLATVRTYPPLSDTLVYYAEYLYNKYIVILAPGPYKALWIEMWRPRAVFNPGNEVQWLEVRETAPGRFTDLDGGYIAARTAVIEHLNAIKRQAKVAIIREILPQYIYPVGNWQIRETVRYALSKDPILRNPSKQELIEAISKLVSAPLEIVNRVIEFIYEEKQTRLDTFFKKS